MGNSKKPRSAVEDTPPVRTIYDRRQHKSIMPESNASQRILVQPSKDKVVANPLLNIFEHLIQPLSVENKLTGVLPVTKFVPKIPNEILSQSSFAQRWRKKTDESVISSPFDEELESLPMERGDFKSPRTSSEESSSSQEDDDSEIEFASDSNTTVVLVEPGEKVSKREIQSANSSDGYESKVEDTNGGDISTSVAIISNDSTSEDEIVDQQTQQQKDILKLFSVKNRYRLDVTGMNMCSKSVEDFYMVAECEETGERTLKCNFMAVLNDLKGFVKTPVALGTILRCHIVRNNKGMDRNIYPKYFLSLEESGSGSGKILLMTARKRKRSTTSNYLISVDPADLSRRGNSCVGKVRSNLLGTQFVIYDSGNSPKKFNFTSLGVDLWNYRHELGLVIYDSNVLGFRGPRKMKIVIPRMLNESERYECRPDVDEDTLIELNKRGSPNTLVEMRNKSPIWNMESQSYVLDFMGRVKQASVKNFQIIHEDKPDYVTLQFGRIDDDNFTMDIRFPLCPLQAFATALTSFDKKIACE